MPMFSLVVSTPSSGTDVVKLPADSPEAARRQFELDSNNAGCEILHVNYPSLKGGACKVKLTS